MEGRRPREQAERVIRESRDRYVEMARDRWAGRKRSADPGDEG